MGRAPCCDKANVKKGPWSPEEDAKLKAYIHNHGIGGNWIALPHKIGLRRCGKSCRLRWLNYLRPNIKHGEFTKEEDNIICTLYLSIGSRWSIIAAQLPGRTDNDIKNYWNTKLKKKLLGFKQQSGEHHIPQIILNKETNKLAADQTVNTFPPPAAYPAPHPSEYHTFTTMESILNNYADVMAADNNVFPAEVNHNEELVYGYQPHEMDRFERLSGVEMVNSSTIASGSSSEGTSCCSWEDISSLLVYPATNQMAPINHEICGQQDYLRFQ